MTLMTRKAAEETENQAFGPRGGALPIHPNRGVAAGHAAGATGTAARTMGSAARTMGSAARTTAAGNVCICCSYTDNYKGELCCATAVARYSHIRDTIFPHQWHDSRTVVAQHISLR